MNIEAIKGLAISTAFLMAGFNNETSAKEVDEEDAWTQIEVGALDYLKWVGVDVKDLTIDKHDIAQCIWGIDDLDEELR